MVVNILILVISLTVLLVASDWFVDGAEKIGLSMGISPFIIGVTIVAFGTSLPELASSIVSVNKGASEIVIGNVVGSNIANILLVLGCTAVFCKEIRMDFDVMDIDMPLLWGSAFLLYFAVNDGYFSLFEAVMFLGGIIAFLLNSISGERSVDLDRPKSDYKDYLKLIIGSALVYLGATYTIEGVVGISNDFNISPDLISLTVVALGTSLPELVVSITAGRKGKTGLAIGNVLGSNMFNTFGVMAIPRFFGELKIPTDILDFSIPFMIGVTILFGMISLSKRVSFWEGAMLVAFYIFYIGTLIQKIV